MIVPIFACPVCIGSSVQNAAAFGGTTVLLSAIPLAIVFGFGAWLRRRARELNSEESPR